MAGETDREEQSDGIVNESACTPFVNVTRKGIRKEAGCVENRGNTDKKEAPLRGRKNSREAGLLYALYILKKLHIFFDRS